MREADHDNHLLIADAERLVASIRKYRSKQVTSRQLKRAAATLVRVYFDVVRKKLAASGSLDLVGTLDSEMQDLLRCTHKSTVKTKYLSILKTIISTLREIEVVTVAKSDNADIVNTTSERVKLLIETVRKLSPSAANSLLQGIMDLSSGDRVSWRGTVVEFRESLREVLDNLAPDQDVTTMPGYRLEKDARGPTMKQKVVYILKSRQTPESESRALADSVAVVDELVGDMVRSVYQRASRATHVALDRKEACRVRDYVLLALSEILEVGE